jgi:hypothetical protein
MPVIAVFRAPVYQTPAEIILVAWLTRFLFGWPGWPSATGRHGSAGPAGLLVADHRLARPGRPDRVRRAGPGDLAVLPAGRVRPVGERPGAQYLAGAGVLAPLARGDDHRRPGTAVPGPDHSARAGQGHLDPVRRPGRADRGAVTVWRLPTRRRGNRRAGSECTGLR